MRAAAGARRGCAWDGAGRYRLRACLGCVVESGQAGQPSAAGAMHGSETAGAAGHFDPASPQILQQPRQAGALGVFLQAAQAATVLCRLPRPHHITPHLALWFAVLAEFPLAFCPKSKASTSVSFIGQTVW